MKATLSVAFIPQTERAGWTHEYVDAESVRWRGRADHRVGRRDPRRAAGRRDPPAATSVGVRHRRPVAATRRPAARPTDVGDAAGRDDRGPTGGGARGRAR